MFESIISAAIDLLASGEQMLPSPWNWILFSWLYTVTSVAVLLVGLGYYEVVRGYEPLNNKPHRVFHGISHAAMSYLAMFCDDWKQNWIAHTMIFMLAAIAGWMFGLFLLLVCFVFLTPTRVWNRKPKAKPAVKPPELTQPRPDY